MQTSNMLLLLYTLFIFNISRLTHASTLVGLPPSTTASSLPNTASSPSTSASSPSTTPSSPSTTPSSQPTMTIAVAAWMPTDATEWPHWLITAGSSPDDKTVIDVDNIASFNVPSGPLIISMPDVTVLATETSATSKRSAAFEFDGPPKFFPFSFLAVTSEPEGTPTSWFPPDFTGLTTISGHPASVAISGPDGPITIPLPHLNTTLISQPSSLAPNTTTPATTVVPTSTTMTQSTVPVTATPTVSKKNGAVRGNAPLYMIAIVGGKALLSLFL